VGPKNEFFKTSTYSIFALHIIDKYISGFILSGKHGKHGKLMEKSGK
jgi:hypothetical protein